MPEGKKNYSTPKKKLVPSFRSVTIIGAKSGSISFHFHKQSLVLSARHHQFSSLRGEILSATVLAIDEVRSDFISNV